MDVVKQVTKHRTAPPPPNKELSSPNVSGPAMKRGCRVS